MKARGAEDGKRASPVHEDVKLPVAESSLAEAALGQGARVGSVVRLAVRGRPPRIDSGFRTVGPGRDGLPVLAEG